MSFNYDNDIVTRRSVLKSSAGGALVSVRPGI